MTDGSDQDDPHDPADPDGRGDGDERGFLGRLRDWLLSLFGGDSADDGSAAGAAPEAVCTVCGTEVAEPASGCPLCGSTDVRPHDGDESSGGGPSEADDESPGVDPERRAVDGTTDDAVTRLQDVREDAAAAGGDGEGETRQSGDGWDGGRSDGDDGSAPAGDAATGAGEGTRAEADAERPAGDG